jgi:glycosyltransferase involved in cell wall biosynthesis
LIRIVNSSTFWGRRKASLRLLFDCLTNPDAVLLINTSTSALIAAMAAKFLPSLGKRCHVYIRDFLWEDLDYVFSRLPGLQILLPSTSVSRRLGYLSPYYLQPTGPAPFSIVPDMAILHVGSVNYNGPFLHLATVNSWKGHVDLLMALKRLKDDHRQVLAHSFGMVGNVQLHTQLHQLIKRLEIGDCFSLLPYLPNPQLHLRDCKAVVVPSVSHSGGPETFGRTVIEAWSYSKPVIAYATGAVADLIEHEVDGLLVPEGDIKALAQAINRLADSPSLCRRLGEAGYEKVKSRFEAGVVTKSLLERLVSTGKKKA